jgi:hypothetical protein
MTRIGNFLGATALVAAAAVGLSAPAQAGYISSWATGLTRGTSPSINTPDLASATVITFDNQQYQNNGSGITYLSPLGANLTIVPASLNVTATPSGAITGGTFQITWIANSVTWTFVADISQSFQRASANGSDSLTMFFLGDVSSNSVSYPSQVAQFVDTFSQAGTNSAVSENGTFSTPVPEPISMVVIGAGLAGLAAVRRRRASV